MTRVVGVTKEYTSSATSSAQWEYSSETKKIFSKFAAEFRLLKKRSILVSSCREGLLREERAREGSQLRKLHSLCTQADEGRRAGRSNQGRVLASARPVFGPRDLQVSQLGSH